jgi:sugar lactone lactonase YvrE
LGIKLYAQLPKLNNAFYKSSGIVVDSKGNAFVTGGNHRIIKITPEGKAELFAGEAGFSNTSGIAIDSSDNLYVADNTRIRKISPDGTVTTFAGNDKSLQKDGTGTAASFREPQNIAIDNSQNLYVTDEGFDVAKDKSFHVLRKITPKAEVTTLKNVGGTIIQIHAIGIACDNKGNIIVCASGSNCIKKITPDGVITTVAGQCNKKFNSYYKEGNVTTSVLSDPFGIAIAKNGDIYFSDAALNRIFKIANNKMITAAGCGKMSFDGNPYGVTEPGEKDGKALQATFDEPTGIVFDKTGNLYIVDGSGRTNSYIRKLSPDGIVSTFCKHYWNPKTEQYEEAD